MMTGLSRFASRMLLGVVASLALVATPAQATPNCKKAALTYAQFSAAATSKAVTIHTTSGREKIHSIELVNDVDFAGTSITAYTIEVGKSGATTKYLPLTNVFTGAANGDANIVTATSHSTEAAGVAIIVTARSTGANLSAGTAGAVTILYCIETLPPGR